MLRGSGPESSLHEACGCVLTKEACDSYGVVPPGGRQKAEVQGPGGKAETRVLVAASADGPRPSLSQILLLDQPLVKKPIFLEEEGSKRYRVTG